MPPARRSQPRSQRPIAAAFLLAALPLVLAIAFSGGALALAPIAAFLLAVLATGRPPGVARLAARRERPPARRERGRAPVPGRPGFSRLCGGGRLIAAALAKRGPPLAC